MNIFYKTIFFKYYFYKNNSNIFLWKVNNNFYDKNERMVVFMKSLCLKMKKILGKGNIKIFKIKLFMLIIWNILILINLQKVMIK